MLLLIFCLIGLRTLLSNLYLAYINCFITNPEMAKILKENAANKCLIKQIHSECYEGRFDNYDLMQKALTLIIHCLKFL